MKKENNFVEYYDDDLEDDEYYDDNTIYCPIGLPYPSALNHCTGCATSCCPYSDWYDD